MSYESMAHEEAREDAYKDGWDHALRSVRDALKGLSRGDHSANYFVDHIVEGFFGEGGRFEVKEDVSDDH